MDKQETIKTVLQQVQPQSVAYSLEAPLRAYLPDSLALVLFIVEVEKVFQITAPLGGFNIDWMNKPVQEIETLIAGWPPSREWQRED